MSYNPYYTREELEQMGFKSLGENVLIDRRTPIDKPYKISIGNNVRIGSFCILAGDITIGDYVHIASYSGLFGSGGIILEDFSGISSYGKIITSSSDYSGEFLANPTVPVEYRKDTTKQVVLKKHSIMGSGALILPGGNLATGAVLGAMSMLQKNTEDFKIYFGIPAKKIKSRKTNILELEKQLKENIQKI